jgi:hypothetical protein
MRSPSGDSAITGKFVATDSSGPRSSAMRTEECSNGTCCGRGVRDQFHNASAAAAVASAAIAHGK